MKKLLLAALVLFVVFAIIAFVMKTQRGESSQLVITGSGTLAELMQQIARRFERVDPNAQVDVQTSSSSRAVTDVRRGLVDIGMASRGPGTDDKDLHWFAVAHDGVAVIVNKNNPVAELSRERTEAIYTCGITNWKDVQGPDRTIDVFNDDEGTGELGVFRDYFKLKSGAAASGARVAGDERMISAVAADPAAIGYASIGAAEYAVHRGADIKLLPASGIAASVENVRRGAYPIRRTLYLLTRSAPRGTAQKFISFAQSKGVYDLVAARGFVPVKK